MADEEDKVEGEGLEEGQEQQPDPKEAAEATKLGWRPKDQFKGDPERWVDAKEFIRRGNEFLPIVRSKLDKAEARVTELETQLTAEMAGLKKMTRVALKRQHDQLTEKFEEQKRKAVETGDTEAYDKIVAKQTTATKELLEEAKEEKTDDKDLGDKTGLTRKEKDLLEDWQDDNTWFQSNAEMTRFADRRWDRFVRDNPDASFEERLEAVREAVEEKFPDKFGKTTNGKGSGANSVEGGSRTGSNGREASLFQKLPAAAKAQADDFIKKDGLFLDKGETVEKNLAQARERYAKDYFANEEQANA